MEPTFVVRTWDACLRPFAIVVLIAGIFAGCGVVRASDVFEVRGVDVDVTAENANLARTQALAEAERKALEFMLRRLTLRADWDRLPIPGGSGIALFVRDFSVIREKTSPVRYIASLAYRFKPDEIRALLRNHDIAFSETVSKPVLVLPVYRQGNGFGLWDDPNPWRDAWENRTPVIGLVPTVLPLGDLSDIASISVDQALAGDAERLQAIADRYGAGDSLVVLGALESAGGTSPAELRVTVSRFSRSVTYPTTVSTMQAAPDETLESLLARAAQELTNRLEDDWKGENLLPVGERQVLPVSVPITGLADWLEIKERLNAVAIIENIDVVLLSRGEARANLVYAGTPEQLTLALEQVDLGLKWSEAGWIVMVAERTNTAR